MEEIQAQEVVLLLRKPLLQFVRGNLRELDNPNSYANGADGDFKLRDKIIIETSLLLYIIQKSFPADDSLAPGLQECAREVALLTAEPRIIALIHKNPQYSLVLGLSFICLKKLGLGNKEYERLLKRIILLNKTHTSEKIPFRELDIKWVRYSYDKGDKIQVNNQASSILSLATSPIYMSKSDAYAVTHAVMYLTDFGSSTSLLKGYDKVNIYQLLHYGLVWCLGAEDFDLTAELLMAYYFCDFQATALTKLCASRLEAVFEATGYLPGPGFDRDAHAQLGASAQASYVFQNAYHTTYVFGMYLCAATLYQKRRKHVSVDARASLMRKRSRNKPVIRESVGKIKKLLKAKFGIAGTGVLDFENYFSSGEPLQYLSRVAASADPQSSFIQVLSQSGLPEYDQCLFLLDALIVSLSKAYGLEMLVDVLCVGLNNFPLISQEFLFQEAVEFLALQQTAEGAIGTFFYQPKNFEDKKNETALFHAKVAYLFDKYLAAAPWPGPRNKSVERRAGPAKAFLLRRGNQSGPIRVNAPAGSA